MFQPPPALPLHLRSYAGPNYSARDRHQALTISQRLPSTATPGPDSRGTSRATL